MSFPTRTILLAVCLTILSPAISGQTISGTASGYPNELSSYKFFSTAKWKTVKPLVSTMSDVRSILGEPSEANDTAAFTKPYPGDVRAKQPVFTYELYPDWQLLVYFVKYCFEGYVPLPPSLDNTVCSLDLIPKKKIPFTSVVFPSVFTSKPVEAIDGAWIEYSDGFGLIYSVYTHAGPYSQLKAGDLNRIVYTASDKVFQEHSTKH